MDENALPGPSREDDPAAYERWFRAKVERARASAEPAVPHDEVVHEMRDLLKPGGRAQARLGR